MAIEEKNPAAHEQGAGVAAGAQQEEVERLKIQLAYLRADFENFRRHQEKERASCTAFAQSRLLVELLPLVDNFERALRDLAIGQLSSSERARFQGMELIYRELQAFLLRHEVKEIPAAGLFDPQLHEAIAQVEVPDKRAGEIVEVAQKGYRYRDMVLRPAKVIVAR